MLKSLHTPLEWFKTYQVKVNKPITWCTVTAESGLAVTAGTPDIKTELTTGEMTEDNKLDTGL